MLTKGQGFPSHPNLELTSFDLLLFPHNTPSCTLEEKNILSYTIIMYRVAEQNGIPNWVPWLLTQRRQSTREITCRQYDSPLISWIYHLLCALSSRLWLCVLICTPSHSLLWELTVKCCFKAWPVPLTPYQRQSLQSSPLDMVVYECLLLMIMSL